MGSGDGELACGQRLGEDNCVSGKVQDGSGNGELVCRAVLSVGK
ncbi:MAG: hypothetical protein ACLS61_16150 [Ruminococcus sp.]